MPSFCISEILQEEAEERSYHDFVPDLQKIQSASKHLLGLISDILDLSKIEAGKMDLCLESFDVRQMLEELINTVGPVVEKNRNRFTVTYGENLGEMRADLTKTRQILFNLLSNAGKFTKEGVIQLEVTRRTVHGRECCAFQVQDTGIGMTAEQTGEALSALYPGRCVDHAEIWWYGAGSGYCVAVLPDDGRRNHGGEQGGGGVDLHRLPASRGG